MIKKTPLQEPLVEAEKSKTTKAQEVFELCKSKACNWYCMLKYFTQIEKVEVNFIKGYPCRQELYFLN